MENMQIAKEIYWLTNLIEEIGFQKLDKEAIFQILEKFIRNFAEYESFHVFCKNKDKYNIVYEKKNTNIGMNTKIDDEILEWMFRSKEISHIPLENGSIALILPFYDTSSIHGYALVICKPENTPMDNLSTKILKVSVHMLSLYMSQMKRNQYVKTLENKQRKNEVFIQNLIENHTLGLAVINENLQIELLNKNAELMLHAKKDRDEIVGEILSENVFDSQMTDQLVRFIGKSLKNGYMIDYEIHFEIEEHEYIYSFSSTVFEFDGEKKILLIVQDVTVQKEYHSLKKMDQMKNDLLMLITHEFQTPLTVLKAYTETLLTEYNESEKENENSQQKQFLETIDYEVQNFSRLIGKIIDYASIKQGNYTFIKQKTDVKKALDDSINNSLKFAEMREMKIEFNDDLKRDKYEITADHEKLIEAFQNIIDNAVKYSDKGKKILISLSETILEDVKDFADTTKTIDFAGKYYLIEFKDQGIGISEEQKDYIFEYFYQEEDGMHHHSGVGLGLPIAKEIIKAHDGDIWFESKKNKGSKFSIILKKES